MNKETIKEIIYIIIAILLSVIAVKFVIWLLPFILIAIVSYLIYNSIKRNKDKNKMNVTRRTCGYLGENFWNVGKTKEIKERVLHL